MFSKDLEKNLQKLDSTFTLEDLLYEKGDITLDDMVSEEDLVYEEILQEVESGNLREGAVERLQEENEYMKSKKRKKRYTHIKEQKYKKYIALGSVRKVETIKPKPKYKYRERTTVNGVVNYVTKRSNVNKHKKSKIKTEKRSERYQTKVGLASYKKIAI